MTDNSSTNEQLLVLKVMRLARPKMAPLEGVPLDLSSEFDKSLVIGLDKTQGEDRYDAAIGEYLIAPQMFENIYLGETFTFYVTVVNESTQKVTGVQVKCELQTQSQSPSQSQRVTLPCNVQDVTMEPNQSEGQIISHEVKEIGQHILICSVNYKTSSGDGMYFRKFFKFPVTKPIDVKTKFYNAENQDVYLEAQIENTSNAPMILEKVELEASQFYRVSRVNNKTDEVAWSKTLKPSDVRQFLFCLSPVGPQATIGHKDLTSIGKLDMTWRTTMGERGRLQTSSLQRIVPGHGDVRLSVEQAPACVNVREQFQINCRLHNCTERSLDLQLRLDQPEPKHYVFCSPSGISLGHLQPSQYVDFVLNLLPITVGFKVVSGIRIKDSLSKRTYEHDDIAQVFVS